MPANNCRRTRAAMRSPVTDKRADRTTMNPDCTTNRPSSPAAIRVGVAAPSGCSAMSRMRPMAAGKASEMADVPNRVTTAIDSGTTSGDARRMRRPSDTRVSAGGGGVPAGDPGGAVPGGAGGGLAITRLIVAHAVSRAGAGDGGAPAGAEYRAAANVAATAGHPPGTNSHAVGRSSGAVNRCGRADGPRMTNRRNIFNLSWR